LNVGFTRALCAVFRALSPGVLGAGRGDPAAERCKAKKNAFSAAPGGGTRRGAKLGVSDALSPPKIKKKYSEKRRVYSAPTASGLPEKAIFGVFFSPLSLSGRCAPRREGGREPRGAGAAPSSSSSSEKLQK